MIIAADLAALRPFIPLPPIFEASYPWFPREPEFLPIGFPNLGIVFIILVLEIGIFRLVSRQGAGRAFWLGFEAAGWACVITSSIFARTIWWHTRSVFEGSLLGRQIGHPLDMSRFILFVGAIHLMVILAIALFVGMLARSIWYQRSNLQKWQLRC
ncbi:hypothetical protein EP7_005023 [Isosphaeraceae bacterium EP7]